MTHDWKEVAREFGSYFNHSEITQRMAEEIASLRKQVTSQAMAYSQRSIERDQAKSDLAQSEAERSRLVSALQKIDDPMTYHHWEEDPYTRAGCFQFIAHEALKGKNDQAKEE